MLLNLIKLCKLMGAPLYGGVPGLCGSATDDVAESLFTKDLEVLGYSNFHFPVPRHFCLSFHPTMCFIKEVAVR